MRVRVSVSASRLPQAGGALRGGGSTMNGSGRGRRARRSWESDVLIPGPVIRWGLPVGLLGQLVHLHLELSQRALSLLSC